MSGFYGVFSPSNLADNLAFEQMSKYAYSDEFDSVSHFESKNLLMGHLLVGTTPEVVYEKLPLQSNSGDYVLTGHFRLDYRDELGDKLGLTLKELVNTPDSRLVMMAYEKWNEECVHHLEGDWAFVLCDLGNRSLFMAKDKTGISALFHIMIGDQVFFSSNTTAILSIKHLSFNIEQEILLNYFRIDHFPFSGYTLIENLLYVNSGTCVKYYEDLKKRQSTYWKLKKISNFRYRYDVDYVYELFSVYAAATCSRLRVTSDLGIFLSGGLDSSSVAALAALGLEKKGGILHSFTSYPHFEKLLPAQKNIMANEVSLVKEMINKYNKICPNYLDFPSYSLRNEFTSPHSQDAYYPFVSKNSYWINGIMSHARIKGIKRMLTGQAGNDTISWSSAFVYADMLYSCNFLKLYHAVRNDQKEYSGGPFLFLFRFLFRPAWAKLKTVFNSTNDKDGDALFPYLEKTVQENYLTFHRNVGRKLTKLKKMANSENNERKNRLEKAIPFGGIKWAISAQAQCMELADPTADARLVQLVFSLPENMFFKSGIHKYIFKLMFAHLIPRILLNNPLIKLQSYDFPYRISNDTDFKYFVREELDSSQGHAKIDTLLLKKLFDAITQYPAKYLNGMDIKLFLNALSIIRFYKRFS